MPRGRSVVQRQADHRDRVPNLPPIVRGSRAAVVRYVAERYAWDPARVDRGILPLADHFGATNEVFYRDPQNYREVTVVWFVKSGQNQYEIREENRAARVARTPAARYTTSLPVKSTTSLNKPTKEAVIMAATRGRAKAKPAPEPEPEVEELEDELEEDESEEDESEEDEDEEDEQDEEDEEAEEEAEAAEEAKDYSGYAGKAPTATMEDFGVWLLAEVYNDEYPGDEDSFLEGVRLGGTLRMEFQRSDFCKQRREERKAETAKAKAAPKAKAVKEAPAKPTTKATAKPAAKATAPVPATPAKRTTPGRPAGRAADRPTKAAAAPARGGRRTAKATAEEPF